MSPDMFHVMAALRQIQVEISELKRIISEMQPGLQIVITLSGDEE